MSRAVDYPLRSMLFVPGHDESMIDHSVETDADAIILDLEDAVPRDQKASARDLIKKKAEAGLFDDVRAFCRVNGIETEFLLEDLLGVATAGIDGFVFPMATDSMDITLFSNHLELIERGHEIDSTFSIVPLIETPGAVMNVQSICDASDRVIAVAFGSEDFLAALEARSTTDQHALEVPRALIAMGARAADVVPIDTVYIDIEDREGFRESVDRARTHGFEGALILHPSQIDVANTGFAPTDSEIEEAREILAHTNELDLEDDGVTTVEDRFIGPPVIKAARKTLERADRLGDDV